MIYIPTEEDKILNQEKEEREFNYVRFLEDVCDDRYILVIGSEVILNKEEFKQFDGDSDKYILNILTYMAGINEKVGSINEFMQKTVDGQTKIVNLFSKGGFKDSHSVADISPELVTFIKSRLFHFVMVTTFDDYVEKLMREVYGDKLRVVNFGDSDDWVAFKKELEALKGKPYDVPTLVYVFGKAAYKPDKKWPKFLKTDDDAIEFIEKWMKEDSNDQKERIVIDFIKGKKVMALGCKFENWYFRFFWYIFRRDFQRIGDGEVAISIDKNESTDLKLESYLKDHNVGMLPDARKFLQEFNKMLSTQTLAKSKHYEAIKRQQHVGGIFLSYKSVNFVIVSQLFFQLKKMGYQVWLDNEELCGGDYRKIIQDAIEKASVFIAVLSPEVATDLQNGNINYFYIKDEWRAAAQITTHNIIPLAVNGYDLRASYHNVFKEIMNDKISGINLMQGEFDKLIKRIEELLNQN